jgi:hypothetical protein
MAWASRSAPSRGSPMPSRRENSFRRRRLLSTSGSIVVVDGHDRIVNEHMHGCLSPLRRDWRKQTQGSFRNTRPSQGYLLRTRNLAEVIWVPGRPERVATSSDDQQPRS